MPNGHSLLPCDEEVPFLLLLVDVLSTSVLAMWEGRSQFDLILFLVIDMTSALQVAWDTCAKSQQTASTVMLCAGYFKLEVCPLKLFDEM